MCVVVRWSLVIIGHRHGPVDEAIRQRRHQRGAPGHRLRQAGTFLNSQIIFEAGFIELQFMNFNNDLQIIAARAILWPFISIACYFR
jgi:hypothetical protein